MRLLLTVIAVLALVAPAAADPSGKDAIGVALHCPGGDVQGMTIEQASSLPFTLTGTSQVAVSHAIWYLDAAGARVDVRSQPGDGLDLVTCTYEYPGFPFLVYGAFAFSAHA